MSSRLKIEIKDPEEVLKQAKKRKHELYEDRNAESIKQEIVLNEPDK